MSGANPFDYDTFIQLDAIRLSNYVAPIMFDRTAIFPPDSLERLVTGLPKYDDAHLVFAIELGVTHRPDLFAHRLPPYLGHDSMSVRCAACRGLDRLAADHVTKELIHAVKSVLAESQEARQVAAGLPGVTTGLLDKLEARLWDR
jgi:hypothetical protein